MSHAADDARKPGPETKMTVGRKLLDRDSHFAFGENWASYAATITDDKIAQATNDLRRLLGGEGLHGRRFLDIGCGSGLHALAAIRLGAAEVVGIDIDPISVETTRRLVASHAPEGARYHFEVRSIFDLTTAEFGEFGVVYSWGVLHHTGDMNRAIRQAATLIAGRGEFLIALYRKTRLCFAWKVEKRAYSQSPKWLQAFLRRLYLLGYGLAIRTKGTTLAERRNEYWKSRGMSLDHDVHDWLGGYPYESISPRELREIMKSLGFELTREWDSGGGRLRNWGFFGSGCFEQAYRKLT